MEFAGAVARPGAPPPEALPQIAFAGRSNVGKSSLINRLLGRTRTAVARVSHTPGKTREINFYRVSAVTGGGSAIRFLLVDLPGYGFARVPRSVREAWRPLIESYLGSARELRGVIHLMDLRHDPRADDRRLLGHLADLGLPALVVLTKADKLPVTRRRERERELREGLGLDEEQVLSVSARTGAGCEALLASLEGLLTEEVP